MVITYEKLTDAEIAFIASLKEETELGWAEITEKYNKKFHKDRSLDSIKKSYQRNKDRLSSDSSYVKVFKDIRSTRRANSLNAKDLKVVIQEWEKRDNILDAVRGAAIDISRLSLSKPIKLPKHGKSKKGMTLELLISDVHVGKLTRTFNLDVLKRRLKQVSDTTIKEMQRASEHYKIDRVILAFIGDLIESATMHGVESARGCEFGNSRQIQEALTHIFYLVFLPICKAAEAHGAIVDAVGVTGNHDRTEQYRTYNDPGEENITWIIYNTMKEFTTLAKLKNVTWHIPTDPWQYLEIYGEGVVYEHYDNSKGKAKIDGILSLLAKRITQIKKPVMFIRGGHFHEPMEAGLGKVVINGNVPGNDGFSTVLGFDCEPTQTLNFYIERDKSDSIKRQTSFYKRFLIQLD